MAKKLRIAVIFGGKSSEHEVSIMSAKNVVAALNKNKYEPVLIFIAKNGDWYKVSAVGPNKIKNKPVTFDSKLLSSLDVVFPILHGTYGEDGTMQGLLKLANVPFVGAGVLGSAVGMDKDVMKRLLRDAGIPVAKFLVFKRGEKIQFEQIKKQLGLPFFVKPANNGSSVGISKVHNKDEFDSSIKEAFMFDNKIIIEEAIVGREIECSVLGNDNPIASVPGEVLPMGGHEFYDYEAKYVDENGAKTEVPAKLSKETIRKIQELAVRSFKILCCEGMGRVDFFISRTGKIYLNEINTIPGFTNISMYPKMWEASGMSYSKLIDRLIELAIERFNSEKKLKTSYS